MCVPYVGVDALFLETIQVCQKTVVNFVKRCNEYSFLVIIHVFNLKLTS